jgi:uncharacterized membrane protein YeiB
MSRPDHLTASDTQRSTLRNLGVDLARGLALLAVFVAHTAPIGPSSPMPERLLLAANDLAAPLFTLLFGTSAGLAARAARREGRSRAQFRLFFAVRAAVLIVFGVLAVIIQPAVIPILHYLGAVGLLLLPVLYLRARWLLLLSAGMVALSAIAMPSAQVVQMNLRMQALEADGSGWVANSAATLVGFVFCDYGYRVSALLAFALAGLAVGRIAVTGWGRLTSLFLVGGALVAVGLGVSTLTGISAAAYAGTAPELVKSIGLACVVLAVSCALAATPVRRALVPITALGTLSLTFYLGHILVLAAWWHLTHLPDDSWKMVLFLCLGSLLGAWLIRLRWRRGPAEWLVHRIALLPMGRPWMSQSTGRAAPEHTP